MNRNYNINKKKRKIMKVFKIISVVLFFALLTTACPRNGENDNGGQITDDCNGENDNGEQITDDFLLKNIEKDEVEGIINKFSDAFNAQVLGSTITQDTILIYAIEAPDALTNTNLARIKLIDVVYNYLDSDISDKWIVNENGNHIVEFTYSETCFKIILEPDRTIFYILLFN